MVELQGSGLQRVQRMIDEKDFSHARAYLIGRLRLFAIEVPKQARDAFFEISSSKILSAWIEENLGPSDIEKLKTAVRQRRMRASRSDIRGISVSAKAHELLVGISMRDGVTFSDVLEDVLVRQCRSARKIKPRDHT